MGRYKVGVIGAGTMGSGVAQKIASEGIDVVMVDVEERFVQKGLDNIKKTLAEAVKRGIFTKEATEEILKRVTGTTDLNALKDADIVIEAVFEDMDVKKNVFAQLDDLCEDKTVLASNTSSFSITHLASTVNRKDRFVGLHFFYHPAKNRLLEVIPGKDTSQGTTDLAHAFSQMIGKTAIRVKDAPGFAVNRFFVPWLNEATRLLEEGVSIPTIDETAKKVFKIGMGPFKLMNVTGVPIAYHSTVSLGNELGRFYSPSNRLKEQFEKGEPWDLEGEVEPERTGLVEERLLGTVFTVACMLVDEGVASIEDTDRGAKIGLRWSLGPFEMMNSYGIERAYEIVEGFVKKYPELKAPKLLRTQRDSKKPWSFSYVDLDISDSIARIIINRPEALNAINEDVIRQLDKHFTAAEGNPEVKAIVLEGAGKAFVAGADISYFIKKIEENKIDDIYQFTKYGHSVINKIDESSKLIIAKLDGLALGGGAEIALAADTIIATKKGRLGFPETGIGIYPGLGGTQRTTRYLGKELAKYMIFTGTILDAKTAQSIGLIEYVVPPEDIDDKIRELVKGTDVLTKSNKGKITLPDRFKTTKQYFSDEGISGLLTGASDLDEMGKKLSKTISYKAPIAIQLANKIIDEGSTLELVQGLQLELDNLNEIFATRDAHEGLKSVVERRRPVFTGE